jgi:5'-deoxynucleotidase
MIAERVSPAMEARFLAFLARLRFIRRWGLMHVSESENVLEHSLLVAFVAHALATIRKQIFGIEADPERVAVIAMFHDASEVITGDVATSVKQFSDSTRLAFAELETYANSELLSMLPTELVGEYKSLLGANGSEAELVKVADKLCAYNKCAQEIANRNCEFQSTFHSILQELEVLESVETKYFLDVFGSSFLRPLDEFR